MDKESTRAEFLKKNSPLKAESNFGEIGEITPPPLFEETDQVAMVSEKQNEASILGDKKDIQETPDEIKMDKLIFWRNWNTKDYTYASLALAVLLVVYVGFSFMNMGGENSPELNATLNVGGESQSKETNSSADETGETQEMVIEEDVIDSTSVIEDMENSSEANASEESDISDYIFENYNL